MDRGEPPEVQRNRYLATTSTSVAEAPRPGNFLPCTRSEIRHVYAFGANLLNDDQRRSTS
jgi:hypothetical protein